MTGSESEAPDRPRLEGNRTRSRTPSPSFVSFNRVGQCGLGAGNRSPWLRGGNPDSSTRVCKLAPVGNSVSTRRARGGVSQTKKQTQKMGNAPFILGISLMVPKRLQLRFLQEQSIAQYFV